MVVRDTVVLITPLLQKRDLELIFNFKSLPSIKFDSLRIKQVVHNLISNAIKFSPDKGKIQMFLKRITVENQYYQEFSIINEGLAIKPEQQSQLFDKYFQVKQKSTPLFKGTGLGLAISRFIIEAHGGTIGYKPEKHERSRFFFQLSESN
jgi:signal transduction histidine kinase